MVNSVSPQPEQTRDYSADPGQSGGVRQEMPNDTVEPALGHPEGVRLESSPSSGHNG